MQKSEEDGLQLVYKEANSILLRTRISRSDDCPFIAGGGHRSFTGGHRQADKEI